MDQSDFESEQSIRLKTKDTVHTYGWFMLVFDRKQQNCVKQLSFN